MNDNVTDINDEREQSDDVDKTQAGAESPEEGEAAMDAADDAVVDDDES